MNLRKPSFTILSNDAPITQEQTVWLNNLEPSIQAQRVQLKAIGAGIGAVVGTVAWGYISTNVIESEANTLQRQIAAINTEMARLKAIRAKTPKDSYDVYKAGYNPFKMINENEDIRKYLLDSKAELPVQQRLYYVENSILEFYRDKTIPRENLFTQLQEDSNPSALKFAEKIRKSIRDRVKTDLIRTYEVSFDDPVIGQLIDAFEIDNLDQIILYLKYIYSSRSFEMKSKFLEQLNNNLTNASDEVLKYIPAIAIPVTAYFATYKALDYVFPHKILSKNEISQMTRENATAKIEEDKKEFTTNEWILNAYNVFKYGCLAFSGVALYNGSWGVGLTVSLSIGAVEVLGRSVQNTIANRQKEEAAKNRALLKQQEDKAKALEEILNTLSKTLNFKVDAPLRLQSGNYFTLNFRILTKNMMIAEKNQRNRTIFIMLLSHFNIEYTSNLDKSIRLVVSDSAIKQLSKVTNLNQKIFDELYNQQQEFIKISEQLDKLMRYPIIYQRKAAEAKSEKINFERYYVITVHMSGELLEKLATLLESHVIQKKNDSLIFKLDKSLSKNEMDQMLGLFKKYFTNKIKSPNIHHQYSPDVFKRTSPLFKRRDKNADESTTSSTQAKSKGNKWKQKEVTSSSIPIPPTIETQTTVFDLGLLGVHTVDVNASKYESKSVIISPFRDGYGIWFIALINYPEDQRDSILFKMLLHAVENAHFAAPSGEAGIKRIVKAGTKNDEADIVNSSHEMKFKGNEFGKFRLFGYQKPSLTGRECLIVFDYNNNNDNKHKMKK